MHRLEFLEIILELDVLDFEVIDNAFLRGQIFETLLSLDFVCILPVSCVVLCLMQIFSSTIEEPMRQILTVFKSCLETPSIACFLVVIV
jgi:hypothetical protein